MIAGFMSGPRRHTLAFSLGVLLSACSVNTGSTRTPRTYSQVMDSPSNACRASAANCAAMGMAPKNAAEAGASIAAALKVLDEAAKKDLSRIMHECANRAADEVDQLRLGGEHPTREQCREVIGRDERGNPITRAMQLGREKHEAALRCVEEKLASLRPGGFALQQRYGHDRQTGRTWLISRAEVEALLRQGRSQELVGTLEPDVVIHAGNPLQVLATYDFKFPCPGTNEARWNPYPEGHPYQFSDQGAMYHSALGVKPFRVSPFWGVR